MASDMELSELADTAGSNLDNNAPRGVRELEAVYDIPVTVSAVLGKATMQVSQLLKNLSKPISLFCGVRS